jgi:hypothetical protein
MFEPSSRYFTVAESSISLTDATGQTRLITYKLRRRLPPAGGRITLVEHMVRQGDRLDHITARYLSDPTQFWQVCDVNVVLRPEEVVERPGRLIQIPLPGIH